jgi:hypothetical protein
MRHKTALGDSYKPSIRDTNGEGSKRPSSPSFPSVYGIILRVVKKGQERIAIFIYFAMNREERLKGLIFT